MLLGMSLRVRQTLSSAGLPPSLIRIICNRTKPMPWRRHKGRAQARDHMAAITERSHSTRFDDLARHLTRRSLDRRTVIRAGIAGSLGAVFGPTVLTSSAAALPCVLPGLRKRKCPAPAACGLTVQPADNTCHPAASIGELHRCQAKGQLRQTSDSTYNGCGSYGCCFSGDIQAGVNKDAVTACCNAHDCCYATCGSKQSDCDKALKECIKNQCSFLSPDERFACNQKVNEIHSGVVAFGKSAFESAQLESCMCCCPPGQILCNGTCTTPCSDGSCPGPSGCVGFCTPQEIATCEGYCLGCACCPDVGGAGIPIGNGKACYDTNMCPP
jgi:Group XII secretory phospholipase A2 precursor (PLA2G12)